MNKGFLKQIETHFKQLAKETDRFKLSEEFQDYLETMSMFWSYSFYYQCLIFLQDKDAAYVAGFKRWQELKRTVKKGSKAVNVFDIF